jgi:hypothetical protein
MLPILPAVGIVGHVRMPVLAILTNPRHEKISRILRNRPRRGVQSTSWRDLAGFAMQSSHSKFDDAKNVAYSQLCRGAGLRLGNLPRDHIHAHSTRRSRFNSQITPMMNFFDTAGRAR